MAAYAAPPRRGEQGKSLPLLDYGKICRIKSRPFFWEKQSDFEQQIVTLGIFIARKDE